ncbi:MAG: site-2 protease family protein [Chloroflexi bacterium]|nr:site-2 protease family protein [Chloroflexota bacterium]
MTKSSFSLGRILGIPVAVHVSWLVIFVLITWSLGGSYFPHQYPDWPPALAWVVGLATSLLFFVSVLVHELAHSAVARARGLPVRGIVLFIFGGVSEITEEPRTAGMEFTMALVGPLSSFILAGLFAVLWLAAGPVSQPLAAFSLYLASINALLGAFNLIPGFPLDGGRVLRAILWGISRNLEEATRWASLAGQGVAYLFILIGVWQVFGGNWLNGLWIAFIGWFLDNAAQTSYRQVAVQRLLTGHAVQEIMSQDCEPLPPRLTLEELVHEHVLATGRRCYPVIEGEQVRGLLTIHNIKTVPRERWGTTVVEEVMTPLEKLKTVGPNQGLWSALEEMTAEGVNQLPVMEGHRLLGILARDSVLTFIRTRAELGV